MPEHANINLIASASGPDAKQTAPREMIVCQDVWKVFGAQSRPYADEVISFAKQGITKAEIQRRTGCVIGVAGVDLTINAGETFCVMGLSGSGKSTLIRHINRLINPSAGSILIDGEDINRLGPNELRSLRLRKFGMVFQHMALFPHKPVWWNVAYGLHLRGVDKQARREVALQTLALVHLEEAADRFPSELSGGMQQRVGIARALAIDPEIMLLDEPFSALDPIIRSQLQHQFAALARTLRKTTVIITHDLDEAMKLGDRVAIMRDGRVIQVGTPEELVLYPKDDYVRRFTQDVPRMKIISAGAIMDPVQADGRIDGGPVVTKNTNIEALIALSDGQAPITVIDESGNVIGQITTKRLLRSIAGPHAEVSISEQNQVSLPSDDLEDVEGI